ncbi:NAD(P)-binding domain-containing protein [Streptomyces sp. NBC_01450]|uniref:NADPH-dependent F420 reductase n=1 Tax=Streptomyces sp. NBC_01450 TaxID=2903871 RepID=UPI002E3200AF|nr:NAD(P)-binding domain-containing protein [Streptomyces sp. NBC_01450]
MTKTLGLIGAGRIGGALARLALAAGLDVVVSNSRGPQTLMDTVAQWGEGARAATAADAARQGDIVVATVPLGALRRLPADALAGKTVVDTMNYYPERDGSLAELDSRELTSSELVQRHLPGARVVKAFNNIDFRRLEILARPAGAADRSALPVAGNSAAAKEETIRLLDVLGYDAVDLGPLSESWRSEPNTAVYVQPYLPERPAGATGDADVMRWFLGCPGAPLPADRLAGLLRDAVRQSPADARERLG